jgi:hypothetical protein
MRFLPTSSRLEAFFLAKSIETLTLMVDRAASISSDNAFFLPNISTIWPQAVE